MRRNLGTYLLTAGALVVALVLLVVSTAPPSQNGDPSSRVAGKAGTLALYDWLGNLGFNVHRISGQFDTSASDVIFIIDPTTALSDGDADTVMRALGNGSDVVLALSADHAGSSAVLLNRLHITIDPARPAGDSAPAQPIDAGDRVRHLPMAAGPAIETAPYLTPLLQQSGLVTGVAEQVSGAGRAYVLASPFPLSNDGLRDGDSATLVLSLLERARGGAIGFDEYHHGESAQAADGAAAIFDSPVGLALLLGVAAVLAFLVLSGRRLGRALHAGDAALVPSTATYIDAMAGLYSRSRDRGAVATRYADELKRRLAVGVGGEVGGDDASFLAALATVRPDLAGEVAALLARARVLASSKPEPSALLAFARDIDRAESRWAEPAVAAPAQWRA
ncbi:MAG TPA: DUF4350 domain-containing protein [Candidatus Dormibacteraeota bacterium]|jgi:hypothetical protein|nr:DUF4350 domain-containing protein [Candidatus Dormibacteraeota bacterium]